MKTFEHEWIFGAFVEHPTFFTKKMFGGLAVYLFERQVPLLVEPTITAFSSPNYRLADHAGCDRTHGGRAIPSSTCTKTTRGCETKVHRFLQL
jgi:hypothetical protein